MQARYQSRAAERIRRVVLFVLLGFVLFGLGRCVYVNRTVAEMNEYGTALTYEGREYEVYSNDYAYLPEGQFGSTQDGCDLYAVVGDAARDFVVGSYPGLREAVRICFVRVGAAIPQSGRLTAVQLNGRNRDVYRAERTEETAVLTAVEAFLADCRTKWPDADSAEGETVSAAPLYLFFEGCPVSDTYAGTFFRREGAWMFKKDGRILPVPDGVLTAWLDESC